MKPRLLFHCQHTLGLGHLVRSLALVRSLTACFDVVLLVGGELPERFPMPPEVAVVALPTLETAAAARRPELVLETFRRMRPAVVVVELYPFGRKKLARELLPMLAEARRAGAAVVSSVRDILVRGRDDQPAHDERAAAVANAHFDAIVVHADPRLVRLEETFRPRTPLRVPVHYSGFVVPQPEPLPRPVHRRGPVVVSAGGGRFGASLLRAAAAAQPEITARTGAQVRLVCGPFLPDADRLELVQQAQRRDALEVVSWVPDLAAELAGARVSVSQCGYNTALDLLRARVPALVVPFAAPGEDEQTRRAERLARLGVARVVDEHELHPETLAELVAAARPPARLDLDLDGARRTRDLLADLAAARTRGAA